MRAPDRAVEAAPAVRPEREDDVVAGLHVGDARADLLDDARRLVAEHHGKRRRPVAVHDVPVAVADARGLHLHAGLAGARALLGQVHDLEGRVRLEEHGSLHAFSFVGVDAWVFGATAVTSTFTAVATATVR